MQNEYGALYVLGVGPGGADLLTLEAQKILERVSCLAGYELYLKLLPDYLKENRRIISSGMRGEYERCEKAIFAARDGLDTALVCSGDPGIYALAGLVIEILEKNDLLDQLPVVVVPGVPAFCAAAAVLGAPVGHDFACISLSDLLTPWDLIEKRLIAALDGDFVCILYNPRSRGRPDYLAKAINLARTRRAATCPVALARNISRPGESLDIATLADFEPEKADMLSIIFIGNNESRRAGRYMLTPRGYAGKYFK